MDKAKNIVVIGGGIAGITAAISAAEENHKIIIIEKSDTLGGNVTRSNVGTICGSYLRSESNQPILIGNYFTQSFIKEIINYLGIESPTKHQSGLYIIPYNWKDLQNYINKKIDAYKNIDVLYNTYPVDIKTNKGLISKVELSNKEEIECDAVIDCSGQAIVSSILKHPLIKSNFYQSASQVFRVFNVNSTSEFSINMSIKKLILEIGENNNWPDCFKSTSVIPGSYRSGMVDIKLTLPNPITDDIDYKRIKQDSSYLVRLFFDALKKQINSFKNAEIKIIFPEVGIRVLNRPQGKKTLTKEDVLETKKPIEGIAIGSWPIEYWSKEGLLSLTTFDEEDYYLIPANCLASKNVENLFFAGKNISATDQAIASARVIGTCIQTGYAAGKLASSTGYNKEVINKLRNELMVADERI